MQCFLHIRGGVSFPETESKSREAFSPHTWRCFFTQPIVVHDRPVFSTYVEVFLNTMALLDVSEGFLHIRGGVSSQTLPGVAMIWFSPHTWRCFSMTCFHPLRAIVFSTYVEVFLNALNVQSPPTRFSPHTWRCFQITSFLLPDRKVFSTYVEVFPSAPIR